MQWDSLRPKRPAWLWGTAATAFAALVVYAVWSRWKPWAPGRFGGLLFGTIAAFIFYLDALYPLRRRLLAWPLRSAQQWLQFHIYSGLLASMFVAIHMGFRLPGGQFGWWLVVLTLWSAASGLAGVYLQKHLPAVMANDLHIEAIYERIPDLAARLQGEADRLVKEAPELMQRFYVSSVRTHLDRLSPSWGYLLDSRAELNRRVAPFTEMLPFLADADRATLTDLQSIVTEKLELDVQYSIQRVLRNWVAFHLVPSMLLLALLAVHIVAALIF